MNNASKRSKIIVAVAVIVIVAIIGIVYFSNSASHKGLKLGILAPLSGEYAVAGENMEKGMQLAASLYQAKHPDQSIELVVEDDGFAAAKGVTAYKKLTSVDHVDAIMMLSTPVIDAIHNDVVKAGIPVLTIGIQTDGVAPDDIFQMSPAPEMPIASFADYANTHYTFKKVAVLYDNTPGGLSFYAAFKAGYKGAFDSFIVNSADSDLRGYAAKIVSGGYDSILFLDSPQTGAMAVKDILTLTKNHPLFMFDAQLQTGWGDYQRILGDTNILNGSISLWLKQGDEATFSAAYKQKYNTDPGFIADFGFDTFNTLMNAYDSNDKVWISNIQNTNTGGASGGVRFDQNGVRLQDIVINTVKDGKIVPIQ